MKEALLFAHRAFQRRIFEPLAQHVQQIKVLPLDAPGRADERRNLGGELRPGAARRAAGHAFPVHGEGAGLGPCRRAFLLPIGAPLPAAPPCILQRRLPRTAGDRHGFPLPPGNRGLVEPEKKSGSDTSSFSQRRHLAGAAKLRWRRAPDPAVGPAHRRAVSHLTQRRREMDSNFRFPERGDRVSSLGLLRKLPSFSARN